MSENGRRTIQVDTVELESGRSTSELRIELERLGGSLVLLKWKPGEATVANLYLPADDARRRACHRIITKWREGNRGSPHSGELVVVEFARSESPAKLEDSRSHRFAQSPSSISS